MTGLGTAPRRCSVRPMPGLRSRPPHMGGSHIGDRGGPCDLVRTNTIAANFDLFHGREPVPSFRSTCSGRMRRMLAKLTALAARGGTCSYRRTTRSRTYVSEKTWIEPLDVTKLPNYDAAGFDPRLRRCQVPVNGVLYAVPKNWGTHGLAREHRHDGGSALTTWKDFLSTGTNGRLSRTGRWCTKYQLTTICNALKYFGQLYQLPSIPNELAAAEKLADRRQAASPFRDLGRLPARDAFRRRLAHHVLDRRRASS